ncbi:MAG: hypothetical protein IJ291_03270 [Lachnospiraceae bacterium]|nr:hypothetical protein [Lachnospiraceae bacterium]
MKAEDLFDAIGDIDDKLIMESDIKRKKKAGFKRYQGILAAAACLLLIVGIVSFLNPLVQRPGSTDNPGISDNPEGNGPLPYDPANPEEWTEPEVVENPGMEPGAEWVNFNAGPVMPMTLVAEDDNISAKRGLTYDFSGTTKENKGVVAVQDKYVLSNSSAEDREITVSYPYVGNIKDMMAAVPALTVDGNTVDADITNGSYLGYDKNGELRHFYPGVLTDDYMTMIKGVEKDWPAIDEGLLEQEVTVYEIDDFTGGNVPADVATLALRLKVKDTGKVFFSHCTGMFSDGEYVTVYVTLAHLPKGGVPKVYVIGEAAEEYSLKGYSYVQISSQYETTEVSGKVIEGQTTVEDVLWDLTNFYTKDAAADSGKKELMKSLGNDRLAEMFTDMYHYRNDGVSSDEDLIFYEPALSDIAYMAFEYEQIYYFTQTVTVPGNGSVSLTWDYVKKGSHNTYEPNEDFRDNFCYDNLPNLETKLYFTEQTAALVETGNIRIEDQNYGFDPERGVLKVTLESDAERYYMVVKVLK